MPAKPALPQNAQIQHPKFGCGTVISCDDRYVVIRFDEHGEKKFLTSLVLPSLRTIDREPPRMKRTSRSRRVQAKEATA